MTAPRRIALLLAAGVCMAAGSRAVQAQELETIKIRAQRGDTVELLAAEYYGDRQWAVFIMKANQMTHPTALRKGQRVKIPVQRRITASVGDTLEALAAQYMGDRRRAEFLADFNNLPHDATIAAGEVIVIPFHVAHTAASRETIESIAAAYFRDRDKAELLRRYNFTDKEALEPGETLVIPIHNVRVRPEKLPAPDEKSAEREQRLRQMKAEANRALPSARAAWRAGDYGTVRSLLVGIELDYLPVGLAVDVGLLRGGAFVAFDDTDSALDSFAHVLRRKPNHAIKAYDFSPKIRDLWKQAGGEIDPNR